MFILLLFFSAASQATTRKDYRRHTDQQLTILAKEIDGLVSKGRALKGESHTRLTGNIRTLRTQLRDARAVWKSVADANAESWSKIKKKLDAKIIRLNKSYHYILNTLREE